MPEEVKELQKDRKIRKVKFWNGKDRFYESVIVDSKPAFLEVDVSTGEILVKHLVITPWGTIRPPKREEMGFMPYEFTSAEIEEYKSVIYDREQLLGDILEVVQRYEDMPLRDQIMHTGSIFLTYCTEWTSTTYHLFFVGDSGSGKTNCTQVSREVGYRCMATGQMTPANIYNFLGTDEEGCGCICEDEAQDLASDKEKMRIYKSSYAKGQKIPKMDMFGRKVQVYYNTYCMVFFSGEGVPEDKAFRQRTVVIYMVKGIPKDNIKRPTDRKWKDEHIGPIRKKLLFWKLQNIGKEFPRVDLGLTGREQELFEDFHSIFAGTKYEAEARNAVDYYVRQMREMIKDSPNGAIFEVLMAHLNGRRETDFESLWKFLTTSGMLDGELESANTYYLRYYDFRLTYNGLSKILVETFRGRKKPTISVIDGKKTKTTYYVFDEQVLNALSEKYHIDDP